MLWREHRWSCLWLRQSWSRAWIKYIGNFTEVWYRGWWFSQTKSGKFQIFCWPFNFTVLFIFFEFSSTGTINPIPVLWLNHKMDIILADAFILLCKILTLNIIFEFYFNSCLKLLTLLLEAKKMPSSKILNSKIF